MGPQLLLLVAVATVGVLHTIVPDHWFPISLLARQEGWTRRETAQAAAVAGVGHSLSTLAIGIVIWLAGTALATRFASMVSTVASVALIGFGLWIALGSMRDLRRGGHGHSHGLFGHHHHDHGHPLEHSHPHPHEPEHMHAHEHHSHPHPHEHGHTHSHQHHSHSHPHEHETGHPHAASHSEEADLGHRHRHRHADGREHTHYHRHSPGSWHAVDGNVALAVVPVHEHDHPKAPRRALMLILGSSPMVEGIPAFLAASRFGIGLIMAMAVVFTVSTVATYVALCVSSAAAVERIRLGPVERYGEVISGAFIAAVGFVFLVWMQW
jgi:hypothetical protein